MCFTNTYMIWFMQYKKLKESNLTQINTRILVMDLTFIFSLIPSLRDDRMLSVKVIVNHGSRKG